MTTNLTPELQEQIRKEAKAEAKKMTARVPVFRIGYEYGHYDGAEVYVDKCKTAEQRADRYEKALNAILNTNHDNYEKVIMKVKQIATEALTPKTSTDDTVNG